MTPPQPGDGHRWLQQLLGDWTVEHEGAGPDQKVTGTERVRKLGELWVVGELEMQMPGGGGTGSAMITLGYDPRRKRFVGTWVGSMMANLWVYDGELDPAGRTLSLYSEGPSFDEKGNAADDTKTSRYRDAIELLGDGRRTFTGSVQKDDGTWHTFMTAHYRRTA
jgi:hypothetical protein